METRVVDDFGRRVVDASGPAPDAAAPPSRVAASVDRVAHGDGGGTRLRLLAALTLLAALAVALVLPFALQAGAEFFLPVTAASIVAIALVPLLEALERRGAPAALAALAALTLFLLLVNGAMALVVVPATDWFARLPESLPRIKANLSPVLDLYANVQAFADRVFAAAANDTAREAAAIQLRTPTSLLDYVTSSAPAAAVQLFFGILLIYFYLAGWTGLRQRTITSRGSFDSALQTARLIQNVIDATSRYLATISIINVMLGALVATALWVLGMPTPLMWGGIVALCNFVPYLGPIIAAALLAIGGLMTFDTVWLAMLPAVLFVGAHFLEANVLTPLVVGRRLTISPLLILLSLSFWGWVWGAPGALLAVPILVIIQTVLQSTGLPDVMGVLLAPAAAPSPAGTSELAPHRSGDFPPATTLGPMRG